MVSLGPIDGELGAGPRRDAAVAAAGARHAAHGGAGQGVESWVACGCLAHLASVYWLSPERAPLGGTDDAEGATVSASLPPVWDGHVHLFPDPVFEALWRWFEAYAWPVRYRLKAPEVLRFVLDRGVRRVIGLAYGHKPGMSRALNAFMAGLAKEEARLVPFATVLPGEPDARQVLVEAKGLGLRGVKLHCHVQAFAVDSEEALAVFAACDALALPVLVHAGREPKSPAYRVDPYALCGAARVERVLSTFPKLRVCVPHFGADEIDDYAAMLARHEGLFLDTTMLLSGFFGAAPWDVVRGAPERILYGTDFPNVPYAWDRELRAIEAAALTPAALEHVLAKSAARFLGEAPDAG